jgi:hypothetical protein
MTNAILQVLDCSPTIVADPGLTNANMQVRLSSSLHVECETKEERKLIARLHERE